MRVRNEVARFEHTLAATDEIKNRKEQQIIWTENEILAFKRKIKHLDANFENLTSRIEIELEPEM